MRKPPKRPPVQRDPALLLPAFRPAVMRLVARLRARGQDPRIWETLRTPQRGAWLKAQGKSQTGDRSIHCIGGAVDIIHRTDYWNNRSFFRILGEEAKKLGLVWGGDWKIRDYPHVQAIEVREQKKFRAMTPAERDIFISERLSGGKEPVAEGHDDETTEAERAARASLPEDKRYENECSRENHEAASTADPHEAHAAISNTAAATEGESVDTGKSRARGRNKKRTSKRSS